MIVMAGGTGRLGRLITGELAARGLPVRVLSRNPARANILAAGVEAVTADVRDPASLARTVRGAKVLISAVHGLTGTGGDSPATVDRDGNINLIDAAGAAGADVVLISILGAAADHPMELFRMKYAAERYLARSGVPATVVRPAAFLELWIEILRRTGGRTGRPVVFGRGENPITFVSAVDVASIVGQVATDPAARGRTLEVGGPRLTFAELAGAVQAEAGRTAPPRHVPRAMLRLGAATLGRFRPTIGRQLRAAIIMDTAEFASDPRSGREAYPDTPLTTVQACLARGH